MVRGLETFRRYFADYLDNYIVIGGTACDIYLDGAGFIPRTTKDIDMILVVEALTPSFVRRFWAFVQDGNYQDQQKSTDNRKYYRFLKPADSRFPFQVELFSRKPDSIGLSEPAHLTPIPAGEDISSLSAILLSDLYYEYLLAHCTEVDGLQVANIEALICLKAKAYLEIKDRIANGSLEDERQIRKHRGDIFRLAVMLAPEQRFVLPGPIKTDMQNFTNDVKDDLPDSVIFKEMGLAGTKTDDLFVLLKTSFQLQ